jgi:hypothetical protein
VDQGEGPATRNEDEVEEPIQMQALAREQLNNWAWLFALPALIRRNLGYNVAHQPHQPDPPPRPIWPRDAQGWMIAVNAGADRYSVAIDHPRAQSIPELPKKLTKIGAPRLSEN